MKGIMNELKIRRENVNKEDKLGWYLRYCKDSFKNGAGKWSYFIYIWFNILYSIYKIKKE